MDMDILSEIKYIIKAVIKIIDTNTQEFVSMMLLITELSVHILSNFGDPKIKKNSPYPIIFDFSPK